jgi:hypothetical protein
LFFLRKSLIFAEHIPLLYPKLQPKSYASQGAKSNKSSKLLIDSRPGTDYFGPCSIIYFDDKGYDVGKTGFGITAASAGLKRSRCCRDKSSG